LPGEAAKCILPGPAAFVSTANSGSGGNNLSTFTLVHVALSLIGIISGLIVALGMLAAKRLDGLTAVFLVTTVLTSVTGFFFPFHGVTPGIVVGIISMVTLLIAILARYALHLAGAWRGIYAVTAMISLYLNCFVLVAQLFEHVPALHELNPAQSGTAFKSAQGVVLVIFLVFTIAAAIKFHPERGRA
jgi:hypothetical protein